MRFSSLRRRITLTYSRWNRARKARFSLSFAERHAVRSVLLVGVSEYNDPHENIVENALIDAGLDVLPTGISTAVTGWDRYVVADARALPFLDGAFDLVISNAVIEHVGALEDQQRLILEHSRVGRHWIVTTPNKWFPIESHTDVLFAHWRASWRDQWGSVTRLLGPTTLRALLPTGSRVHGWPWSPTLTATSD
jgi:hypothetical protein